MTAETLEQQIAALNRTLAEAMKEHEVCKGTGVFQWQGDAPCIGDGRSEPPCDGTGRVARFPGFRQACSWCRGKKRILKNYLVIGDEPYRPVDEDYDPCAHCHEVGWQVRAGGLEDALASLDTRQAGDVLTALAHWFGGHSVRTTAPKILAEGLRLVCEIAGLEVPDAQVVT